MNEPISEYAPGHRKAAGDPLRLAGITIQAVDQIGERTAVEIERTAHCITQGAAEVAEGLRQLAGAIREHSQTAGEQIAAFVNKTTHVLEGVRALQQRLTESSEQQAEQQRQGNGTGIERPSDGR